MGMAGVGGSIVCGGNGDNCTWTTILKMWKKKNRTLLRLNLCLDFWKTLYLPIMSSLRNNSLPFPKSMIGTKNDPKYLSSWTSHNSPRASMYTAGCEAVADYRKGVPLPCRLWLTVVGNYWILDRRTYIWCQDDIII